MRSRMRFVASGSVQGIGYRYFVCEVADRLSLNGWVRNRSDGTVEGEAEGTSDALKHFIEELRTAHPFARISGLETRELQPLDREEPFRILHTI